MTTQLPSRKPRPKQDAVELNFTNSLQETLAGYPFYAENMVAKVHKPNCGNIIEDDICQPLINQEV